MHSWKCKRTNASAAGNEGWARSWLGEASRPPAQLAKSRYCALARGPAKRTQRNFESCDRLRRTTRRSLAAIAARPSAQTARRMQRALQARQRQFRPLRRAAAFFHDGSRSDPSSPPRLPAGSHASPAPWRSCPHVGRMLTQSRIPLKRFASWSWCLKPSHALAEENSSQSKRRRLTVNRERHSAMQTLWQCRAAKNSSKVGSLPARN